MDVETASATPRSPVSCAITLRGHTVVQDKPATLGGQDEGPMASELLLGSLLACQLSTFHKIAAKRGADVQPERLDGEIHFDDRGDIAAIHIHWLLAGGPSKDAEGIEALLRLTEKVCTISKALRVPCEVTHSFA